MYGLTPLDVKQMTLREVNLYIIGSRMRVQQEREQQISQAYFTAQFAMSKKVKPLEYYLKESRRVNGYLISDTKPVDVAKSRRLADIIDKLK